MMSALTRAAAVASLAAIGWLAPSGAATADPPKQPNDRALPSVLQAGVKAGQITVKKQFATDAPGITGYVIEMNGQHRIVYGDHDYLLTGDLISPEGRNLSATYADRYVPKPDVTQVVKKLESTGHLVQQGPDDAPVLYVFADPNCIYCHRFYQQAKPLARAGKVQIQWALVGFLKPSSHGRAAAILSADEPSRALADNEKGFDEQAEDGGIKPLDSPSDEINSVIKSHNKQLAAAGGHGTPTVLYKKPNGQWAARVGMPPKHWLTNYLDRQ